MPQITYIQPSGEKHEVELETGVTVMAGALLHGIPGIDGDCGGQCACGTCHVYVDEQWVDRIDPIDDREQEMLSFAAEARANSRLGCQITIDEKLDGLKIHLPDGQH